MARIFEVLSDPAMLESFNMPFEDPLYELGVIKKWGLSGMYHRNDAAGRGAEFKEDIIDISKCLGYVMMGQEDRSTKTLCAIMHHITPGTDPENFHENYFTIEPMFHPATGDMIKDIVIKEKDKVKRVIRQRIVINVVADGEVEFKLESEIARNEFTPLLEKIHPILMAEFEQSPVLVPE